MRLAYFNPDRLLTGLYKQETEILWSKDDGNINKQTDIDRHGPEPSLNSSQPPVPPPFSLPTTFKPKHRQNIGDDKILAATKHWRQKRVLARTKYWRGPNVCIKKMFASTECLGWQNTHVDKMLASTKCRRRQNVGACAEASPYHFGPSKSAAADFSQTSLMFSSCKTLCSPRAVTKCDVAAGRPAFMGGLSLYRPAMQKTSQILASTKYRRLPRFHWFSPNYSSQYLCSQASHQKLVKAKSTRRQYFVSA